MKMQKEIGVKIAFGGGMNPHFVRYLTHYLNREAVTSGNKMTLDITTYIQQEGSEKIQKQDFKGAAIGGFGARGKHDPIDIVHPALKAAAAGVAPVPMDQTIYGLHPGKVEPKRTTPVYDLLIVLSHAFNTKGMYGENARHRRDTDVKPQDIRKLPTKIFVLSDDFNQYSLDFKRAMQGMNIAYGTTKGTTQAEIKNCLCAAAAEKWEKVSDLLDEPQALRSENSRFFARNILGMHAKYLL